MTINKLNKKKINSFYRQKIYKKNYNLNKTKILNYIQNGKKKNYLETNPK